MTLITKFGFAVVFLGWLMPGHYVPWLSFQQEWVSAVGVALIAAGVVAARSRLRGAPVPLIAAVVAIVACVPAIQFAGGMIDFASDALLASLYLVGFALAMVIGAMATEHDRDAFLNGVFAAFLCAGLVSVGLAATQWLQLGEISWIDAARAGARPYANLGQPNHLASLLALACVAAVWLFESRQIGPVGATLALAWLGSGLVMTQSRTAWVFVLLLAGSALWMRRRTALRTRPLAVAIGIAAFATAVWCWSLLSDQLLVNVPALEGRLQGGTRPRNWSNLLHALQNSPWLGYGWTQVRHAVQDAALTRTFPEAMLLNSHNLILDLLIWNGVVLGGAITVFLLWWFGRCLSRCRTMPSWLLLVGVSALFVHALLEYPLEYAYFLLPAGLLIGAFEAQQGPSQIRLPVATVVAPIVLAVSALVMVGVEYITVEASARDLRLLMMGVGRDKVPDVPAPQVRLLDALREYHQFWRTPAKPGMTAAEVDWMRRVARRYPTPPAQLRFALAAGLNGRSEEAIRTLTVICHMHQAERCQEGRESWVAAKQQYEGLRAVPFPDAAMLAVGGKP
jgi:Virulence factor membrane-bound polymerase, C-terminal/O-Antigen ligase/Protein glycosylation ligase